MSTKSLISKIILPILRNKYLVAIIVFVLWIVIFDSHSLIDRYSNLQNLNELKKEHQFYVDEFEYYQDRYTELFSGRDELEKFAREQYKMRASDEIVFVIP
jgi:cell division protein DivIC